MTATLELRHRVGIAGRVTERPGGRLLSGALVVIVEAPDAFKALVAARADAHGAGWDQLLERIDRRLTAADGHFHFLDLPPGRYTLAASMPAAVRRHGNDEAEVEVAAPDAATRITRADLVLPATAIAGKVTDPQARPVGGATVRIEGSSERTVTDGEGAFVLAGVELGARTLLVSARGLRPASRRVKLDKAGEIARRSIQLAAAS